MKKHWHLAGAAGGCLLGALIGACGQAASSGAGGSAGTGGSASTSSSSTGSSTSGSTSSSGTGSSSSSSGAGGATSSSSTSSSGGTGGGMCGKVTMLHPPKLDGGANTLYCPFSGVDGGKAEYCDPATEHCCETPAGNADPSACQPNATACMTGTGFVDWGCEDPVADCQDPSKPVCCATGLNGKNSSIGLGAPGCGNFAHDMTGTACVAAGTCAGITICTSDAECPGGMKCTPFGKAGNQMGGCM